MILYFSGERGCHIGYAQNYRTTDFHEKKNQRFFLSLSLTIFSRFKIKPTNNHETRTAQRASTFLRQGHQAATNYTHFSSPPNIVDLFSSRSLRYGKKSKKRQKKKSSQAKWTRLKTLPPTKFTKAANKTRASPDAFTAGMNNTL